MERDENRCEVTSADLCDTVKVFEQYKTAENLTARISIHDKYSTNHQGFGNWIFEQYCFFEGCHVLELGCGNAAMWKGRALPPNAHLWLTDLSEGMLSAAQRHIPAGGMVSLAQVDIQNIPFPDNTFDTLIANMMLYHVPDLDCALREVSRVLKSDGTFFCATYGENSIAEFVRSAVARYMREQKTPMNHVFTLQNGTSILKKHFDQVEKRLYHDSLAVTDTRDLVAYIRTMSSMADCGDVSDEELFRILDDMKIDGVLTVPKEYGIFVCRK
ncbi:MAG: class I SAM-dependent methyltransferase [Ruminococcaceae bacterium]|nr:class I SAM-dependent methyltransferase [Oscillospiraceae bacterium]